MKTIQVAIDTDINATINKLNKMVADIYKASKSDAEAKMIAASEGLDLEGLEKRLLDILI